MYILNSIFMSFFFLFKISYFVVLLSPNLDEEDLHFCHDAAEAVVLGFQHYLLTVGITVLIPSIIVPQMGGGDVSIIFL